MANYADVKAIIDTYIKRNGIKAITGNILNGVLTEMLTELGAGYQYGGMAVPDTDPGAPDYNVVYLAATAGTYTDFDGITLAEGEIALLKYNGSWSKDTVGDFYSRDNIDSMLADYVRQEPGKGLSTNDYTDEDKAKLDGVEDGAQVNVIEGVSVNGTRLQPDENKVVDVDVPTDLSELNEDAEHRLVTDDDITNWDAKYDKPAGGIPADDLAQAVRDLLALADSSLQPSAIVQETGQQTGKVMSQKAVTDAVATVAAEVSQLGQEIYTVGETIGPNNVKDITGGFVFVQSSAVFANGAIPSGDAYAGWAASDFVDVSNYQKVKIALRNINNATIGLCFYDRNKTRIDGKGLNEYYDSNREDGIHFVVLDVSSASYIRISYPSNTKLSSANWQSFSGYYFIPDRLGDYESNKLNVVYNKATVLCNINLFDKTDRLIKNGYYSGGTFIPNNNYRVTGPIFVRKGIEYKANFAASVIGSSNNIFLRVDSENTKIGEIAGIISGNYITFTPEEDCLISLNIGNSGALNSFMVCEASSFPQSYVPYSASLEERIGLNGRQKEEVISASDVLAGKTITLNGDSICYGNGYPGGYGKIISDAHNMGYQNIAVSGGTITSGTTGSGGSNRHWICDTVQNMNANADFAIFEGGVNDAALYITPGTGFALGELSSGYTATLDKTTFYGAMETLCKTALTYFDHAKIGFVIVHKMTPAFISPNGSIYNAVVECLEKWGIPYINLNKECPPLAYVDSLKNAYTTAGDGWHPNEAGYRRFYVPKIEAWMKTL